MIDGERIREWSDEAAAEGDPLLSVLLLHVVTLRNLRDHRSIEILKNYAGIRVRDGVALQAPDVWEAEIPG